MRSLLPSARFHVHRGGSAVDVEAGSWLIALNRAAEFLDVGLTTPGEWTARVDDDGDVEVGLPDGSQVGIRTLGAAVQVRAVGVDLDEQFDQFQEEETPTAQWPPPPAIRMPESSLGRSMVIFDGAALAERLFDLTGTLSELGPEGAAQALLELMEQELIECGWASVVRGTVDDDRMVHIAGVGQRGRALVGHEAPYEAGLVGAAHHSGMTLRTNALDPERLAHLPADARADLEDLMCVPVVLDDGRTWGVIALADVAEQTPDAAFEAVEMVARTLGAIVV